MGILEDTFSGNNVFGGQRQATPRRKRLFPRVRCAAPGRSLVQACAAVAAHAMTNRPLGAPAWKMARKLAIFQAVLRGAVRRCDCVALAMHK